MHTVKREMTILRQARLDDKPVLAMMSFAPPGNPTALRPGLDFYTKQASRRQLDAGGQNPYDAETERHYHEEDVVKKVLVILVMLLVIGQLVWTMG